MKTPPNAELAKTWQCTVRTVIRWRRAGAPLADPSAMRRWLAGQRTLPAGTRALLDATPKRRSTRRKETVPTAGATGAEFALVRLQDQEARAHEAFLSAVEARNPIDIRSSRVTWLALLGELRRYDESVQENRRHSGRMIPLDEVVADLRLIGGTICAAFNGVFDGEVANACARATTAAEVATLLQATWPWRFQSGIGWARNLVKHKPLFDAYCDGVSGTSLKPAIENSKLMVEMLQALGDLSDAKAVAYVRKLATDQVEELKRAGLL